MFEITADNQIYACFFLIFSMITAEEKEYVESVKMPVCRYTLRRDSINGPIIKYTEVGSTVYHVWTCEEGDE